MLLEKKNIFCFLDIGTFKTACLICSFKQKKMTPLALSFVKTKGMRRGKIYDASELRNTILTAVYDAEQKASVNVESVFLSVPAGEVAQKNVVVNDVLFGKQVLKEDIKKLVNKAFIEIDSSKNEIIHFFPLRFCLDEVTIVKSPENLFADKIEAEVNLIHAPLAYLVNMATILAGCHLKPEDFVLNVYASSIAVCTKEELNKILVVDIGGETTSSAYFEDGNLVGVSMVPMGGVNITKDIAAVFSINSAEAERLKTVFGDLLGHNDGELVKIKQFSNKSSDEPNTIKKSFLNKVIVARIEEIIEHIKKQTAKLPYDKIIITGGGGKLAGIEACFTKQLGKYAQVRFPKYNTEIKELNKDPSFSTLVGLAEYMIRFDSSASKTLITKGPIGKIIRWLKENF